MKLLDLMDLKGYSYRNLRDASGVALSVIQDIVEEKRVPHPETMRKIATALGVEITDVDEFVRAIEKRRAKEHPLTALNQQGVLNERVAVRAVALSVS